MGCYLYGLDGSCIHNLLWQSTEHVTSVHGHPRTRLHIPSPTSWVGSMAPLAYSLIFELGLACPRLA